MKIHTRAKRRNRLSTHKSWHSFFHKKEKKNGPKTFGTEEAARAWALNHTLKSEQYFLKPVKGNKRFQAVLKK